MIEILNQITNKTPYLIINKNANFPSAPLSNSDINNAFSLAANKFPEILTVKGKKDVEHGLLHRLDNVTEGLLLIAANQEFYDYMQNEQNEGRFCKTYHAQCKINIENSKKLGGFPELKRYNIKEGEEFTITSMFRPFGKGNKEVRPVIESSSNVILKKVGKKINYTTRIKILSVKNDIVEVECKLYAGFRHQIRCHLAWIGLPIVNDPVYNFNNFGNNENQIRFIATGLEFYYPKGDLNSYVRKYTWT